MDGGMHRQCTCVPVPGTRYKYYVCVDNGKNKKHQTQLNQGNFIFSFTSQFFFQGEPLMIGWCMQRNSIRSLSLYLFLSYSVSLSLGKNSYRMNP